MSDTSETLSDATTPDGGFMQMEMRGGPDKVHGPIFLTMPSSSPVPEVMHSSDDDDEDDDDIDSYDSDRTIPEDMKMYMIKMYSNDIEDIRPQDRWNMDEILFRRKKSSINCFEAVSADGRAISPMVVFQTETVENDWISANRPDGDRKYVFVSKQHGGSKQKVRQEKEALAETWLVKMFHPLTVPRNDQGKPAPHLLRLLVVDDHHSHVSKRFKRLCQKLHIVVLTVPEIISHFAMPFEMSIAPKLRKLVNKLDKALPVVEGEVWPHRFVKIVDEARLEVLTKENIEESWSATGLWPVDDDRVRRLEASVGARKPRGGSWVIGLASRFS